MDIPAPAQHPFRTLKILLIVAGVFSLAGFAWMRAKNYSDSTFADLDELVLAEVNRGNLVREVRAPGTLVPVQLHFVAATSSGRVASIFLEAGETVAANTVIMALENPELSQALDAAQYELDVLAAEFNALKQRLHQALLNQRARVADFSARYQMAKLRSQANSTLLDKGAVSSIDYNEAQLLEQQLQEQYAIEVERLDNLPILNQAELIAADARVNKAKRLLALQQELVDDMQVKAGIDGVVQEIPLEQGERFNAGTVLARVAGKEQLKAELRVQESQVKNVTEGQVVVISAGGFHANGTVRRIDPAVQEGVVIVDVYFDGEILSGARPDLRVDGIIQLEKLADVLLVKRPVFARENAAADLFVMRNNKNIAEKIRVELGKGSVDLIEIKSNLQVGDRIVVSDTSQFNRTNVIHLR